MRKLIPLICVLSLTISWMIAQPIYEPRIYQIKWREAGDIEEILRGFLVQHQISKSGTFNTLTVNTVPEQHALVQELIRKYDVPAKTIEFQFYVLEASRGGQGLKDGVPEPIQKVLKEVSSLTKYDTFELLDTPVLRATEGKNASVSGKGNFYYHLLVGRPTLMKTEQGMEIIRVDEFAINFEIQMGVGKEGLKTVGIHTPFTIQDEETIVLGASQIQREVMVRTVDPEGRGLKLGPEKEGRGEAVVTLVTARVVE